MTESDKPASRFSRRSFIKTAGAGAAVAGASLEDQEKKPEIIGPDAAPITLKVNGVARKVTVEPGSPCCARCATNWRSREPRRCAIAAVAAPARS
jgi:hypothetical protein